MSASEWDQLSPARKAQIYAYRRARVTPESKAMKNQKSRDKYRADAAVRALSAARALMRNYGLSVADIERMRAKQADRCHLCKHVFVTTPHVDHFHDGALGFYGTKNDWQWREWVTPEQKRRTVRWLACCGCNTAAGQFDDEPMTLRRVADEIDGFNRQYAAVGNAP